MATKLTVTASTMLEMSLTIATLSFRSGVVSWIERAQLNLSLCPLSRRYKRVDAVTPDNWVTWAVSPPLPRLASQDPRAGGEISLRRPPGGLPRCFQQGRPQLPRDDRMPIHGEPHTHPRRAARGLPELGWRVHRFSKPIQPRSHAVWRASRSHMSARSALPEERAGKGASPLAVHSVSGDHEKGKYRETVRESRSSWQELGPAGTRLTPTSNEGNRSDTRRDRASDVVASITSRWLASLDGLGARPTARPAPTEPVERNQQRRADGDGRGTDRTALQGARRRK